jgi:GDPmannose 4,6-dehydratase
VIATGETHSVQEFCELAFAQVGLDAGEHVKTDPEVLRPAEVDRLVGDASKARAEFGWAPKLGGPAKITFRAPRRATSTSSAWR